MVRGAVANGAGVRNATRDGLASAGVCVRGGLSALARVVLWRVLL